MNIEHLKNVLFYAGLGKMGYQQIKQDIADENLRNMKVYVGLIDAFLLLSSIAGYFSKTSASANEVIYLIFLILCCAFSLILHFLAGKHRGIVLPLAYTFMVMLYVLAYAIAALHKDLPAVTLMVFLLAIPLLFLDRPIRMAGMTVCVVVLFCIAATKTKSPGIAEMDVWNAVSFGIVAIVIEVFVIRMRIQNFEQAKRITELSEKDLLTGLRNRNSYEKNLDHYQKSCKNNLICVYGDVNGLHELNNTRGHEAGDRMLKEVALEFRNQFGERDTYRIGGDEFVAFAADTTKQDVEDRLRMMEEAYRQEGYHVSFGCAIVEADVLNISSLIKLAESDMYKNKTTYYELNHITRR